MTTIPANVAAARQQAIETDFFALGFLALSAAAYSGSQGPVSGIPAALASNLGLLGEIGEVPGSWTLDWGPAISQDNANLIYVASYRDEVSGVPIFTTVAIRGTDIYAVNGGVLKQIIEDLAVGTQVSWPGGVPTTSRSNPISTSPCVANGTFQGFQELIALTATAPNGQASQTVGQFLTAFLALPGNADNASPLPLIVTGHSLGGCQTSPMTLYLATQLTMPGVTIVPHSFAAPTAGNPAFAALYEQTFPTARRWFNTYDAVPMGFGDLATIQSLWNAAPYPCGIAMGLAVKLSLELLQGMVGTLQYAHEGDSADRALTGACGPGWQGNHPWLCQLAAQHFPFSGYWPQMVAQYQVGSLELPSWPKPPSPGGCVPQAGS